MKDNSELRFAVLIDARMSLTVMLKVFWRRLRNMAHQQ